VPDALRREVLLHGAAAVIGASIGLALVGSVVIGLLWRAAALSSALTLVVVAIIRALALGRSEWRREPPSRREYAQVVARFGVAFMLAVVASS